MSRRYETSDSTRGLVAVALGVVAGGFATVLVKRIDLQGLPLAVHRTWLAAVVVVGILHLRRGRLTWRGLRLATPGGLAYGLQTALMFVALKTTAVANATVIQSLRPVLLLVLVGPLFEERVTWRDATWTAAALGGVVVLVIGSAGSPVWSPGGDLLAALALAAGTWYLVASKQARRGLGALEYQACISLVALLLLLVLALVSHQSLRVSNPGTWWWIAVVAVVPSFSHVLINWAHLHVPLSIMSILTLGIPLVAVLAATVVLSEPLGPGQLLGISIVFVSLSFVVRGAARDLRVVE